MEYIEDPLTLSELVEGNTRRRGGTTISATVFVKTEGRLHGPRRLLRNAKQDENKIDVLGANTVILPPEERKGNSLESLLLELTIVLRQLSPNAQRKAPLNNKLKPNSRYIPSQPTSAPIDIFGDALLGDSIKQQEVGYACVLNSVLAPLIDKRCRLWAPQFIAQMRTEFFLLYNQLGFIRQKLEEALSSKRLYLKPDSDFTFDLGLAHRMMRLLVSYDLKWLSLGVETITGQQTSDNLDADTGTMLRYLNQFFLKQPTFRYLEQRELFQHKIIVNILMVILMIDVQAKHYPARTIFKHTSAVKSSRNMLQSLANLCLAGEGDLTVHLRRMGYVVSYVQSPFDEFDYRIKNIATDLRCGMRLTKCIEVLTGDSSYTKQLRVPANDKSAMLHNAAIILSAIRDHGITLIVDHGVQLSAHDIVSGYRERTLQIVWRIISRWAFSHIVQEDTLRGEISKIESTILMRTAQLSPVCSCVFAPTNEQLNYPNNDTEIWLLHQWVVRAAELYGHKVETANIDLKALDCLVRYYGIRSSTHLSHPIDFTAGLSLLASLSHSLPRLPIRYRAAVTIQRQARLWLSSDEQRLQSHAAKVIQRAFRTHLDNKIKILIGKVVQIQSHVRGMLLRRKLYADQTMTQQQSIAEELFSP